MIKGVSHIGVAVDNLEEARALFKSISGRESTEPETFGELRFSFVPLGDIHDIHIELLESTTPEGVIRKFIEKKGEGVHHISLKVDDIESELLEMKSKGFQLINEKPYFNAHRNLVAFLHPKSTRGVLVELIQYTNGKEDGVR